jgi:hypothetical protein
MILYHMSDSLAEGTELTLDYKKNIYLIEPFVKVLNISTTMFQTLLLNADYLGSVLEKYNLTGMPAHAYKWAAEGIFEYVRRKEFPDQIGRVSCNYFYPDLKLCSQLYYEDWGEASEEERSKIKLYEVEVSGRTASYDMHLFDEAFDYLYDDSTDAGLEHCMDLARKYFRGEKGEDAVMEILSDGKAVAVREIDKARLIAPPAHKSLEERAAEYDGKLNLDGELNWKGDSVGKEIW